MADIDFKLEICYSREENNKFTLGGKTSALSRDAGSVAGGGKW
jgi:hypothetical protein